MGKVYSMQRTIVIILIILIARIGFSDEPSAKVVNDYNPILNSIVNMAQQEAYNLTNRNNMKLLSVEYKKFRLKSKKYSEEVKKSLIPYDDQWMWVVSFGPTSAGEPVAVGGGCKIYIPDSEKMKVALAIRTK